MSSIDIAISIIILIGTYSGYKQGFLMSLFTLLAIILGILGGFKLMGWAMILLAGEFDIDKSVLPYIAFAVVFVMIVITVRLLGNLVKWSIDKSFLGSADQVAGAILGIFKATFLLSVFLWIIDSLRIEFPERWVTDSWLYPKVAAFAPAVTSWISEIFPVFRDVF